jgi:hypothetical protein
VGYTSGYVNLDDPRQKQGGLALQWDRLVLGVGGSRQGRAAAAAADAEGRGRRCGGNGSWPPDGGGAGSGAGPGNGTGSASGRRLHFVLPLYGRTRVPERPMAVPPPPHTKQRMGMQGSRRQTSHPDGEQHAAKGGQAPGPPKPTTRRQ